MHVFSRPGRYIGLTVVISMVLAMTAAVQLPAFAATFTVDTLADTIDADPGDGTCADADGACSLRAAVQETNALPGADVVTLPAGTYLLTIAGAGEDAAATGDLDVTDTLTVNGADRPTTIIDGGGLDRVVHGLAAVTLSGLTVRNGDVTGGTTAVTNDGGGLLTSVEATLTDVDFTANDAGRAGGGIEVQTGSLTAQAVSFATNSASVNGGAVHVSAGTTGFTGGTVSLNTAAREGGGFWNGAAGSTMTVDGTTFTTNTASGAESHDGGGSLFNNGGVLIVSNVTSTGGVADGAAGSGGGLLSIGGSIDIDSTSFDDGSATRAGGGIELVNTHTSVDLDDVDFGGNATGANPGNGGAIHVTGNIGTVTIDGGDVTDNTATNEGGGFWNGSGTMAVTGTTFTDNSAAGTTAAAATDPAGGGSLFNNGGTLNLVGITSTGGDATGAGGSGGGLLSFGGALDVDTSSFDAGSAVRAGGGVEIVGTHTAVTLDAVDFAGNAAASGPGNGGAIHVTGDPGATVAVTGGDVTSNTAAREGGGFWNDIGAMVVDGTTFTTNSAFGPAADDGGGSLFNNGGSLTVLNSTSTGGRADGVAGSGGGLLSIGGSIDIDDSSIDGGFATRAGGGIELVNAHTLADLDNVDFDGNGTGANPGNGGAIHVTGNIGTVTVDGGEVTNGTAANEGGGFWNGSGAMIVTGTTFFSNAANGTTSAAGTDPAGGGALFNNGGALQLVDVTVTDGIARGGDAMSPTGSSGGGLLSFGGSLDIDGSTFSSSEALRAGGGIEIVGAHTAVTIDDTDFDTNSAGSAPGNGGAIHVTGDPGTPVLVTGGVVSENTATAEGGGFWNDSGTMTVSGTTFTDNVASGADATNGGGSLFNNGGTLDVTGITSTGGTADGALGSGGGIFTDGGTLRVTASTLSGGIASRAGGAIETNGSAVATITGSTLDDNTAGINGGALHITGPGDVTVDTTTVSGNTASSEGGGLWNSATGLLRVTESLVTGNDAQGVTDGNGGGGLFSDGGDIAVTNSTVTANTAANEGSQVYVVGGSTDLTFTTIAEPAGSIAVDGVAAIATGTIEAAMITLRNSIIVASADGACDGNVDSGGGNVVSDATCELDGTGDKASTDPLVSALADNGGPTRTHALQPTSPAIRAAVGDCLATDQRGVTRPSTACDSGAYEAAEDVTAPDTTITAGPSGAVTTTSTLDYRFTSPDDTATFECRITGSSNTPWAACTSPFSTTLADGSYRFSVRAEDPAGNVDPTPATRDVTIDTDDEFIDDDDSIFEADIERLHAAGITKGCNPPTNNRFCPDDAVTRAELAAFLVRALNLPPGRETFRDVDASDTFAADIGALQRSGITKGCNPPANDRFCPDDLVPRKEVAGFLRRALELTPTPEQFRDVRSSDTFARDIGAIARAGITKGCNPPTNDLFCPDDLLTRGQVAALFVRAGLT